mgnify:CR=1 FL=1
MTTDDLCRELSPQAACPRGPHRHPSKPQGPFTLWQDFGNGWSFVDFPTLVLALEAPRYTNQWHISKPAVYVVMEDEA